MTCALVKPTSGERTFSRLVSLRLRPSIWTSTEVSLATFAHHLASGLVEAETLECRRAQLASPRPLDELELAHDLWFDEVCRTWRRAEIERILVRGQWLQRLVQLFQCLVREPGTDLSGVGEFAVLVIADQNGARIAAPLAFALEPAADHELLAHPVFDLLPDPGAPPRFVPGVELFGHDAFQAALDARVFHGLSAALLIRRRLPRRTGQLEQG